MSQSRKTIEAVIKYDWEVKDADGWKLFGGHEERADPLLTEIVLRRSYLDVRRVEVVIVRKEDWGRKMRGRTIDLNKLGLPYPGTVGYGKVPSVILDIRNTEKI